ncbi:MAG TPA: photosynthetic reaction center cytochrome c subunit family protein [Terriglobales bacterium]|nr:photosynthetic reaction center cytochrome c subunit family protein [Terriglobales bacterium]
MNPHPTRTLVAAVLAMAVIVAGLVARAQQSPHQQPSTQQPSTQAPPSQQPPAQGEAPQAQKPPMRNTIPDTFTNLQVLPKDIAKPELVRIMKTFCITFEKRCSYCHVATDDLSQADFASDEKETKKKARELLRFILDTQKKPAATP